MLEDKVDSLPLGMANTAAALDDKKAENIKILHVGPISTITDYFIIVTGTSNPHLRALGKSVRDVLDEEGVDYVASTSNEESGWVVVDAFDFIVHIFTSETRTFYNLEGLWKDAEVVDSAEA